MQSQAHLLPRIASEIGVLLYTGIYDFTIPPGSVFDFLARTFPAWATADRTVWRATGAETGPRAAAGQRKFESKKNGDTDKNHPKSNPPASGSDSHRPSSSPHLAGRPGSRLAAGQFLAFVQSAFNVTLAVTQGGHMVPFSNPQAAFEIAHRFVAGGGVWER
jgi:hypothetical protein